MFGGFVLFAGTGDFTILEGKANRLAGRMFLYASSQNLDYIRVSSRVARRRVERRARLPSSQARSSESE